jgi:hypothetical protein
VTLFDDAEEPQDILAGVMCGGSTPQTRERYAILRTKRFGPYAGGQRAALSQPIEMR